MTHSGSRLFAVLGALGLAATAAAATFTVNVGQGGGTIFVDQTSGNSTTTIQVGDTVQWVWQSGPHSTTSGTCTGSGYYGGCTPDGKWDSGVNNPPNMFSKTFSQTGTFNYYCSIHQSMMTGMVVVQAAAGPPPTAGFRFSPTGPVTGTTVHFTDTSTSPNPTHVFSAAGSYSVMLSSTNSAGTQSMTQTVVVAAGGATTCTPNAKTMCLNSSRFQVTAVWQKTDGTSGPGTAVPLTADSGYFWFFDPTNIELVTKVLAACAVNNDYWVFSAGLTNVQVTLTILDTSNGVSETYVNPQGTAYAPIQDTAAFPTCP